MSRVTKIAALGVALGVLEPGVACAAERLSSASAPVHMGLGLVGLIVAAVLLFETLKVRKLAMGGMVADRLGLVVLATVCLAASALAEWATNFVVDLTFEEIELASKVLVVVAMALMAAYFSAMRSTMRSYIRGAQDAQPTEEPEPAAEGGDGDSA